LDRHRDPQALSVEPVLVALVEAAHRLVALVDVLVGARPGVVDAHSLDVRGDRAVDEGEAPLAGVPPAERVEAPLPLPEVEHPMLELGQVELRADRSEARPLARLRHATSSYYKYQRRPETLGTPGWRGTTRVGAG